MVTYKAASGKYFDPKKLYAAGNILFATENEGASWTALGGDLTTNDKVRQRSSGGPVGRNQP